MNCLYCGKPVGNGLRKCRECGEPVYWMDKALKYNPLLSIFWTALVAILPWCLVFVESVWQQNAMNLANEAKNAEISARREIVTKEQAAESALQTLLKYVPPQAMETVAKDYNLPDRDATHNLEGQVKMMPESVETQKRLYLYKALKRP